MKIIALQDFLAWWKNTRCFAAVVRSPLATRAAFEGHCLLSRWWKLVLALHGKPVAVDLSPQQHVRCIADGFRFYGWLYRVLAVVFGVGAVLCLAGNIVGLFWIVMLATSAVYLWTTAGLAFSGAVEFYESGGERIWQLVAFLFFVALFLASLLTAMSFEARSLGWLPDAVNGSLSAGLMAFGTGSYLIELAALVNSEAGRKARVA
jgi:hypothetical protein